MSKTYLAITKSAAKLAFERGDTNIVIQASNIDPHGTMGVYPLVKYDYGFDEVLRVFKHYNCNEESGHGVKFYTCTETQSETEST